MNARMLQEAMKNSPSSSSEDDSEEEDEKDEIKIPKTWGEQKALQAQISKMQSAASKGRKKIGKQIFVHLS